MDSIPSFTEFHDLVERYLLYTDDDELTFKQQVQDDTERFDNIFRNNAQLEEISEKITTIKFQQDQLDKILRQISCAQIQMEKTVSVIEQEQEKTGVHDNESQRAKICNLMQKIFTELENLKSGNRFLIRKNNNNKGSGSAKEILDTISQTIIHYFRCCELIHAKIIDIQDKLEKIR